MAEWVKYEDAETIYTAAGDRLSGGDAMLQSLATAWGRRDPQVAAETFLADGLGSGVPAVISEWVKRDSVEASRFIRENLQPGDVRDLTVSNLVLGIAQQDPEAAHEWAATISDPTQRAQVLEAIERDP